MTERLYYKDSHLAEFDAKVISCEKSGENYEVVLDRTAFFPEGGGQAADTGFLGNVRILDVQEKNGRILHKAEGYLEPGIEVKGRIDWEQRFSRMQQHTGEHILSGLIHARFGYDNVGFHLSDDICTLDLNGPMTKEEVREIENEANEAVFACIPVEVIYPTKEELETLEYRSKIEIEGQVRIVKIPGYDVCACCAPHLDNTGEIGLIKLVGVQNYKGGVRLTVVCGRRALADYQAKEDSVKAIMFSLSSKEELIADAVEKLKEETNALKSKLAEARREVLAAKVTGIEAGEDMVCLFETGLEGSEPRELMNLVLDRNVRVCGVFAGTDESGYRYVIGSRTEDVRSLGKELNQAFEGRGGGKPEMVQGSLKGTASAIKEYFMKVQ
ncbi:MAG: alanine--tRNA ligase-related protein [Bariatricus sp.]